MAAKKTSKKTAKKTGKQGATPTESVAGADLQTQRTKPFPGTNLQLADPSLHDVRVHHPAYKPSDIGAKAYATGSDLYFSNGAYTPGGGAGKHLLGHELTHVVQQ